MGRQVYELLRELSLRDDLQGKYRFILYSNNPLRDDPLFDHPLFVRRPVGMKSVFGSWAPSSFSLHYYVLLPLRLWWDSSRDGVRAIYYPNYMLPIIHPPHVASLVMLTDDIFRESRNPALAFRYRIAYRIFGTFWAKRFARRIMAISHASAGALTRLGVAPSRIVVNEMGIVPPEATSYQLQATSCDFLFIGQAFPRRHLKETLEAFEHLAQERAGLTFRFIGRDKYPEPVIAELISDINRRLDREAVTSAEYVPQEELSRAYRSARTLVYVSDTEGFGMPPLEALAHGTVPVVADTPVNREIYGNDAVFVPTPITGEGIGNAMRRSLADASARERILSAGPGIVARYSWKAHADRFVRIMDSLTA
ncbi:MAG TPA: glycosyltransferase [Candidatus Paceibacterota bacterium]|nr:glycosyltransferase [Candidatus Paceibacterota bacterium]